jgi:raffinose/stachyose/melibiose transport system substrate-binding protein
MKGSWRRRATQPRWGTLIATMAVATLAVTACSPSDENEGGGDGDKVTLTLWSWRPEDASAYAKIFDKFEASHPNITVEFKPFKNTEYNNILATGLSGESGPDVAQLRAYGLLQPLVEAGRLVPLDGKVPGLESFDPAILQDAKGRKDGKIYGVPFAYQTLQVFYNKKIFADNGIQPPTTWDQMIAAANKLKQADVIPFAATAGPDGTWTLPVLHEIFGNSRYGVSSSSRASSTAQSSSPTRTMSPRSN